MVETVLPNFINGNFKDAHGEQHVEVVSPATEEVIGVAPISNTADVNEAFQAAEAAAKEWRNTTPAERQEYLLKIADAVAENADFLAKEQQKDTGQIFSFILNDEVLASVGQLRFFAGAARTLPGLSAGEYMDGMTSYVRREPIGVVAQIVPWNYPFMMMVWKIGPALAAGNTIVLKPSETTPHSALAFAKVTKDILPPGVFNLVLGDGQTGELLASHPVPGLVALTGSVRAGQQVAQATANGLTRVHLELGGKAPVIVFADADLESAATGIAEAGLFNAGQDCTAATRVLVEKEVAPRFTELLVQAVESLKTGNYEDADSFYGPLNNRRHFEKVSSMVDAAPTHARILTGGHQVGSTGFYYAPTVIAGLQQEDDLVQNEIFGPVITMQEFVGEEDALNKANGVRYALSSSVWTKDHSRAMRFSKDLDFGCVWINTHIPLVAEMPHGGFKDSGYGKDLSMYGVEDYTRIKHVMSQL